MRSSKPQSATSRRDAFDRSLLTFHLRRLFSSVSVTAAGQQILETRKSPTSRVGYGTSVTRLLVTPFEKRSRTLRKILLSLPNWFDVFLGKESTDRRTSQSTSKGKQSRRVNPFLRPFASNFLQSAPMNRIPSLGRSTGKYKRTVLINPLPHLVTKTLYKRSVERKTHLPSVPTVIQCST